MGGVCGRALILYRLPILGAGSQGALSTCCGGGRAGLGTRQYPFGAHALWGITGRGVAAGCSGGGPLTIVLRGVCCQALSLSRLSVVGACSRAPPPVSAGRGWCGWGDPAPAPGRAFLQAGVARCGDGRRASLGGVPHTVVRGVWGQVLSLLLLPVNGSGS